MDIYKFIAVGLGGLLGSLARFMMSRSIDGYIKSFIPYGTLIVNVLGSFILGVVYALSVRKLGISENWRLFLGAGFCGGFTTFSTFAWENVNLLSQKNISTSITYIVVSLVVGVAAVFFGGWVGRSV
jgi:CrcB protein